MIGTRQQRVGDDRAIKGGNTTQVNAPAQQYVSIQHYLIIRKIARMLSTTSKAKPLEDVFPEDPTQPAYSVLANSGSPFSIPWPNEPVGNITLGSGFHSSELGATDVQTPFQTKAAFSEASLAERVRFSPVSGARSTFYKAVTSDAQNSAEHLSVSFKGGSGGKVLGASVSGKYNKEVMSNRAVRPLSCPWM